MLICHGENKVNSSILSLYIIVDELCFFRVLMSVDIADIIFILYYNYETLIMSKEILVMIIIMVIIIIIIKKKKEGKTLVIL